MKIGLDLAWRIELDGVEYVLEPLLFELLAAVEKGGHLNYASRATEVSYRHAWGLMRTWEARFKAPLVDLQRGRGATLTDIGRALLEARERAQLATGPTLAEVAGEASALLQQSMGGARVGLRVASSHSDLLTGLVDALDASRWQVVLDVIGSEAALRRYQRGEIDIAGFHLPLGELGPTVGLKLLALLDDARDQVFLLEMRALGLISRPEAPVTALETLPRSGLRFINRQPGAGTRLVFDGLLGLRGIPPGEITGYRNEEYTHSAVAAMVASGGADAGFGTASAAARFGLHFQPFVQERFYLCLRRSARREVSDAVTAYVTSVLNAGPRPASMNPVQPGVGLLRRLHAAL
ncbi:MAG: substrate-binding domain-containing protein [Gammaproteobacteria bacterium]